MKNGFLMALSLIMLLGCASTDPKMKAQIDELSNSLAKKGTQIEAPTELMPPELASGQWAKWKVMDKKRRPGFITYKVLDSEGDAFWLEVENESYTGRSISKILAKIDRVNYENCEIRGAIMKNGDSEPVKIEGPALKMTQGLYKKILKSMVIEWKQVSQETIGVYAGRFTDAYIVNSKTSIGPYTMESKGWYHSEVPINGAVKLEGEDGFTMELVDFGMSGATSGM